MENNKLQVVTNETLGSYLTAMGLAAKLNEKEKTQFLEISQAFNLNPFKREIYCVKYGDNLSIIVGYESYIKRAESSGLLNGWSVTTQGNLKDNSLKAIVTINRKDWDKPFEHEVYFIEYNQNNRFWKEKPVTMIKKVAIAQSFRLCFSESIGGMPYTKEEIVTEEVSYQDVTIMEDVIDSAIIKEIKEATDLNHLKKIWTNNKKWQKNVDFINAKEQRKKELETINTNENGTN